MAKLLALNFLRFLREHLVAWSLLFIIYSATLGVVLRAILENAFHEDPGFMAGWAWGLMLLVIPATIAWVRFPPLPFWRGVYSEARRAGEFTVLYFQQESRKLNTWILILFAALGTSLLPLRLRPFAILLTQLPVQGALLRLREWRWIALQSGGTKSSGSRMLWAFILSQSVNAIVFWTVVAFSAPWDWAQYFRLGLACLAAASVASSVALEGDSGVPGLVNFISAASGTLAGFVTLAWPYLFPGAIYFVSGQIRRSGGRLLSVELHDEDRLLS